MIYVHEVHEVVGGKMEEFGEAVRSVWRPLLEERAEARLLWYWEITHGTGASYQAVTLTAVRDWTTWGDLVARRGADPRFRDWDQQSWNLRKDVTAKILLPAAWSPLNEIDLAPTPPPQVAQPSLYLQDTGWPFPGKLEAYVDALGRILRPQEVRTGMVSVAGCFVVAPGTGRHHEVLILQRIDDWDRFARLLTQGEQGPQRGGWMEEGLRYRDRWESKLLRCAPWSPRQ